MKFQQRFFLSALIFLISISAISDPALERPPVLLGQGEQRIIKIPGLLKYSLGSDIVRAHKLQKSDSKQDEILLKGVQAGLTDLWVWKKDGSTEQRPIEVIKQTLQDTPSTLLKALSRLEEVEVLFTGSGVVLRGEISSMAEAARVAAILRFSKTKSEIQDETEISGSLLDQGHRRIGDWLKSSKHTDELRIELRDGNLWVRGGLKQSSDLPQIEKKVRALFPLVLTEIDTLPDSSPTVHFRVYLLELRKSKFGAFGIGWPGAQEAAFRVTSSRVDSFLQLDLTLQALEGEGAAKILSKPELVVRAPGEAELFAGGELPIQLQKIYYSNVTWKPFGLSLRLKVTHSAGDKVRLEIFTEVSHLDTNIGNNTIPGIQANRMRTQVDARFGVPLLLSGLLQEGTREQARGLPLLRNIPILGALFGSEDYLNERSELVAILLPSSSPPPAPMHRVIKNYPKGSVPPPRHWVSPDEEKSLKQSADYPWNAF